MKRVVVKQGHTLSIQGRPSLILKDLDRPKVVSVLPSSISFIKPKVLVSVGDKVSVGDPLFCDKGDSRICFLSPGGGTVTEIVYGDRRQVERISVTLDSSEGFRSFPTYEVSSLSELSRDSLVQLICEGGLWGSFKEYPFAKIPSPDTVPPAIYVSLDQDEPFLPQSEVYLKGKLDELRFGLSILRLLCSVVHVGVFEKNSSLRSLLRDEITHVISGEYPANDPHVFLYHTKKSSQFNASWGIRGQDVLRLASLFREGRYPISRVIVVAGAGVDDPKHYTAWEGISLGDVIEIPAYAGMTDKETGMTDKETGMTDKETGMTDKETGMTDKETGMTDKETGVTEAVDPTKKILNGAKDNYRYIAGGVLTGQKRSFDSCLGYYDYALNVIEEGVQPEFLRFLKLGFDKIGYSPVYFSALMPHFSSMTLTSGVYGEERACISCGLCSSVCPVDILPQELMKVIQISEVDEALSHGVLDCTECGLCTYVCPSKIDLDTMFRKFKQTLFLKKGSSV